MTSQKESIDAVVQKLDNSVLKVIGNNKLAGFNKAHVVSSAIVELKALLTEDYMKPIMALQGTKLGFRTDKDLVKGPNGWCKGPGYPVEVVRDCLIEAVLMGLQPTGNQFNIIAGNTYPTKEGIGYLLNTFPGLKYDLVCGVPRVNQDKTGAVVEVSIKWTLGRDVGDKVIPIAIRMDSYTSIDAVIGKATRKGRAWLLGQITGMELPEGDATENTSYTEVKDHEITLEDLQLQYDTKKALLTEEERTRIGEIIKNKEKQSYKKAYDAIVNR